MNNHKLPTVVIYEIPAHVDFQYVEDYFKLVSFFSDIHCHSRKKVKTNL